MASKVASLMIDVAANVAGVRKDLDGVAKSIQNFGKIADTIGSAVKGFVAGFTVDRIIAFGEGIMASVDAMDDLAENLKIPTTEFQALQNAALLAGQSIEATGAAIGKFNVFIGKASEGGKEQIETLNRLGVKILDIQGNIRPTSELLAEMAQKILAITDPARRAAAEVAVFGKTGQSVSAILTQWAKGTDELNRELEALGIVHSPEVIKSIGEMARQTDIAQKQIEVLFGQFYAMAKSAVMQAIASGFKTIADAINGINVGNLESITRALAALVAIGTGNPLVALKTLTGMPTALEVVDKQIADTTANLGALEAEVRRFYDSDQRHSAAAVAAAEKYRAEQAKLLDLQVKRNALTGATVDMRRTPPGGVSNPRPEGSGADKFAEAMRRVTEETAGAQLAYDKFKESIAAGASTRDAEKAAKLAQDIAQKQSQMTKGLTDEQAAILKPRIENLVRLTAQYDKLRDSQREADQVSRQYGDGQKELAEATEKLNELKRDGLITEREYTAAMEQANQKAEQQRLINQGIGEGIGQVAAGFEYAARKMMESNSSFAIGQQLFTNSFQLMSDAITEFVDTGVFDFDKLAKSFAKMLADMAIRAAASAVFNSIFPAAGAAGGAASGGGLFGWLGGIFGGGRAAGGPVMPGYSYLVGETGPERFVPNVPGTIQSTGGNGGGGDVTVNLDMRLADGARDANSAIEFGRRVKAAVVDVISQEKRPGGTLYARGA